MRIEEKRKEWRIYFSTRRELLTFEREFRKRYKMCNVDISQVDDGKEILWIQKNEKINRKQIEDLASFLMLI